MEEQGKQDLESPDTPEEEAAAPPKPVPEELPEDGDPEDFEPEPVPDEDFDDSAAEDDTMDNNEDIEVSSPDLSGIDKEFDDNDDNT